MGHSRFEYDTENEKDEAHYYTRKINKRNCLLLVFSGVCLLVALILIIVIALAATGFIHLKEQDICKNKMSTTISEDDYGTSSSGQQVKRYKLHNTKSDMEAEIITYGGTITSLKVPGKSGQLVDVVLGFDTLQGYEGPANPYFSSLVGRFANRIANARFTYDGQEYQLTVNDGQNHLHGGTIGWNKAIWKATVESGSLILSHISLDGDQGYPGTVTANVTFDLTDEGELRLQYKATTQGKVTPINLTTHPYFNLGGEGSGNIFNHEAALYADKYTPVSDALIPTGELTSVTNTIFDLRQPKLLNTVLDNVPGGGYDHNFCINGPTGRRKAARVKSLDTGIVMEVYTNQPGVQFYTANGLNLSESNGTKNGHSYPKHSAFCLETQNYPDAVNQENFPDPFLAPGSEYEHTVWYKFSTE